MAVKCDIYCRRRLARRVKLDLFFLVCYDGEVVIERNKKDKKTKNERRITMKVKEKTGWWGWKFIIRLAQKDESDKVVRRYLAEILSSLAKLSRLPYYCYPSFDYIYNNMVFAAEKLWRALSNIEKIRKEEPSCRYLSQEEKERLHAEGEKIKDLLSEVLSKLQEMVKTTPEGVSEKSTKLPLPEAEAPKPDVSTPPEE